MLQFSFLIAAYVKFTSAAETWHLQGRFIINIYFMQVSWRNDMWHIEPFTNDNINLYWVFKISICCFLTQNLLFAEQKLIVQVMKKKSRNERIFDFDEPPLNQEVDLVFRIHLTSLDAKLIL